MNLLKSILNNIVTQIISLVTSGISIAYYLSLIKVTLIEHISFVICLIVSLLMFCAALTFIFIKQFRKIKKLTTLEQHPKGYLSDKNKNAYCPNHEPPLMIGKMYARKFGSWGYNCTQCDLFWFIDE